MSQWADDAGRSDWREAMDRAAEEDLRPECPLCGGEMRNRQSRFGRFRGCTSFPKCHGKRRGWLEDSGREGAK